MPMKKLVNIRNIIIVLLCITIMSLGIGFSYLSIKLESLKNKNEVFNISFTDVISTSKIQGGNTPPSMANIITNSAKTLHFKFNMSYPKDEISFKVIIKNEGSLPGKIISIIESPDYLNNKEEAEKIYPVTITHNNVVGKVLSPEEEIELNVVAIFDYKATSIPKSFDYEISIITSSPTSE